jgi:hypothetical protein
MVFRLACNHRKTYPAACIQDQAEQSKVYDMLNWIDWLGVLIERKAFADPALMLRSIDSTLRKAITLSKQVLNEQGRAEWPGVFTVADWLDLVGKDGKVG